MSAWSNISESKDVRETSQENQTPFRASSVAVPSTPPKKSVDKQITSPSSNDHQKQARRFYGTSVSSPSSPQTPGRQYRSKSAVPTRWKPTYPSSSRNSPATGEGYDNYDPFPYLGNREEVISASQHPISMGFPPGLPIPQPPLASQAPQAPFSPAHFSIYDETEPIYPQQPQRFHPESSPFQMSGMWSHSINNINRDASKSPQALNNLMLTKAQDDYADQYDIVQNFAEMNLLSESSPIVSSTDRTERTFPVFPREPAGKPFAPLGYNVAKMSEIPTFLDQYLPKQVLAMFGNYIVSCDDIDDELDVMRIGQLSIFIPIMMNNEICIVGLAPCELFHTNWKGTGSHVPSPDRSVVGKRAYEVEVHEPLPTDWTSDRRIAKPTGNTLGTVIGLVGSACVLRIEKWYLRSDKFKNDSRYISVVESDIITKTQHSKPTIHRYATVEAYDEYQHELKRKAELRKEIEETKLSISEMGGTLDCIPRWSGWTPPAIDPGPIAPPKYLSPTFITGVPEPRVSPLRGYWNPSEEANVDKKGNGATVGLVTQQEDVGIQPGDDIYYKERRGLFWGRASD